jgi:hypothetical protein
MKKLFVALTLFAATVATAQTPYDPYAKAAFSLNYSATSTAGAAITTPVFDLRRTGSIQAYLRNDSGSVSRTLIFKCLAADGTTALFTNATVTVGTSASGAMTIDPYISSVSAASGQTKSPILPCAKGQFAVAAAGTSAALQVLGRGGDPLRVNYETSVAAGAAVDSPVFDTSKVNLISVLVDNSAGAGNRTLTYKCIADDGTSVLFTSAGLAVAETAPGNAILTLTSRASAATATTRQTIHPMPPCKKMSFHIAAAGAAAVGLAVYGR